MTDDSALPTSAEVMARARHALSTKGERRLADILGRLRLQIDAVVDTWSISGRPVLAYRGALLAPQRLFLSLRENDPDREAIRAAVRGAFDTRQRVMRELTVALDAESLGVAREHEVVTGHPYRSDRRMAPPPSPALLRTAAENYARAAKDLVCADLLARARVLCEPAAPRSTDRRSCYRVHVLVSLEDLAEALRDRSLQVRMTDILRAVGTSLDHTIGDVTMSPWLEGIRDTASIVGPARRRTAALQELLAAEGVACVLLGDTHGAARLVAHLHGHTVVIDVAEGTGWRPIDQQLSHVHVGADEADAPELARRVRDLLRAAAKRER